MAAPSGNSSRANGSKAFAAIAGVIALAGGISSVYVPQQARIRAMEGQLVRLRDAMDKHKDAIGHPGLMQMSHMFDRDIQGLKTAMQRSIHELDVKLQLEVGFVRELLEERTGNARHNLNTGRRDSPDILPQP